MPSDHLALVAILAMAAVTYATRIAGFWLMGHLPLTPRLRRGLEALPGSVIAATILPMMANTGAPALVAIGVVILVMMRWRNDLLALGSGMAAGLAVRALGY